MAVSRSEPLLNLRFRVEVDGMPETGVVEVVFPQARLTGRTHTESRASYGTLVLRRGVRRSQEWHTWWEETRKTRRARSRTVNVTLLDESGVSAQRWTFRNARPLAYALSNLNAVRQEVLIETLELTVGSFETSAASPSSSQRRRRA